MKQRSNIKKKKRKKIRKKKQKKKLDNRICIKKRTHIRV